MCVRSYIVYIRVCLCWVEYASETFDTLASLRYIFRLSVGRPGSVSEDFPPLWCAEQLVGRCLAHVSFSYSLRYGIELYGSWR